MDIGFVSAVLAIAVILLITGRFQADLTALGIIVVLMLGGIITPGAALAGFANPAPLTVGALFVVSRGLHRTGALDLLTERMVELTQGKPRRVLVVTLIVAGAFSALLNNTAVVVMFIGIILGICGRSGLAASRFLMPISFVSILAGTSTLIGTSTNIIVSDLAAGLGQAPIGMFELSRLGVPLALLGALYLFLFSERLLPAHRVPALEVGRHQAHRYITELLIPESSRLVGREPRSGLSERYPSIEVYEVFRGRRILNPHADECTIRAGDLVLVKAPAGDLVNILKEGHAALPGDVEGEFTRPDAEDHQIAELIVPPTSELAGHRLVDTHLGHEPRLHVIGVQRRKVKYSEQRAATLRLSIGDVLLVQGSVEVLDEYRVAGDVLVVDDVVHVIRNRGRAPLAVMIFAAMVIVASTGMASILVSSFTAAFLMIATRCLRRREAYASVNAKVLLLIIGTLALGRALQETGAAELYARSFLSLFSAGGSAGDPRLVLGALVFLTSVLSHFLSNSATAVLLTPVGIATAVAMGVDPRPFVIGICFGASACYATPIGYHTNLMIFGPGRYAFTDFVKLGMPLNVIVWIGTTLFVPMFWPF